MLTKGMLMVTTGIGGLVITVIVAIALLSVMRRKELKAKNEVDELNSASSNSGLRGSISQRTDIIATESINNSSEATEFIPESGTETDVLVSEKAPSGTDILESQGTEVLMTKTTVISH